MIIFFIFSTENGPAKCVSCWEEMQGKTSHAWHCSHSKGYQLGRGGLSLSFCFFSLWLKIGKPENRAGAQTYDFLD